MAISSFVRSLFDPEAMGEQIIISIQDLYEKTKKLNPADDPHIILAMTYFARVRARIVNIPIARKIDPNDPNTFTLMLVESLLFACLPEGHNIRALALKILQDERPDIWERYPKFEADAQMRVGTLLKQIESGKSLRDLYKLKNYQLQIAHMAPVVFEMLECGLSDFLLTGVGLSQIDESEGAIINEFDTHHTMQDLKSSIEENFKVGSPENFPELPLAHNTLANRNSVSEFKRAKIAIEYSSAAAKAWSSVQVLPENYQFEFLSKLEASPTQDAESLAVDLEAQYRLELRPLDSDEANDAFEQAGTISAKAQSEFREVYQTLRGAVSTQEILNKIEGRFGPSAKTKQIEAEKKEGERFAAEKLEKLNLKLTQNENVHNQILWNSLVTRQKEAEKIEGERTAAEKLEMISLKSAEGKVSAQVTTKWVERFSKTLSLMNRHQLLTLMICLLALMYLAFSST